VGFWFGFCIGYCLLIIDLIVFSSNFWSDDDDATFLVLITVILYSEILKKEIS
jgi:hypothetical protein